MLKIIAEIGINHDGSYDKAAALVSAAAASGANAIKFQYRNLDNAYSSDTSREIGDEILLREIHKSFLPSEHLLTLTHLAHELGIESGISFFDVQDIQDFGESISYFDFFKIPSAELTNAPLIDALMKLSRHLYISTGCHNEAEIESAFKRLPTSGWSPMHCISNYPLSLQNAKLGYISHLRRRWDREVGYSSHDDHWETCLLAIQLGANVIERHITLDRRAEGLDHSSSSTPDEFAKLAGFSDNFELLTAGDGPRVPNQGELLNRQNLGRSFFASHDLPIGHVLSSKDLIYRSPNIGLNRQDIESCLGSSLKQFVPKGASLVKSMFKEELVLPERVVEFARKNGLSLPVRLHDIDAMGKRFPINAFEFHLSYGEVLSDIDVSGFNADIRYSIHLPDYINSTQLMDPFSADEDQQIASMQILERTVGLAERLQDLTKKDVPIVGSFSVVHGKREDFFESHAELFKQYQLRGVTVMPQWLPPIAWYFGGSVELYAMNNLCDSELLIRHRLTTCLDICHMIMGRNFYGFSATELMSNLGPLVGHLHLADAAGIDGEGLAFGDGEPENLDLFRRAFEFDCLKVIEVWQGHLDQGAGFYKALVKLEDLYGHY